MKKAAFISVLFLFSLRIGCSQPESDALSGKLIIFHAGSLSVPMREIAAAFMKIHPGVTVLLESAGSVECARKITDLKKPCDIMASSDYKVIDKMLIPDYADWNLPFASNEMCIVYTGKSNGAGTINSTNWYEILMRKEILYGRSDPDSDPCGYRSLMTMQLAEKFYKKPGMARALENKDRQFIRPKEVDLIALLETHSVDYIFLYKSVAVQHGLNYITLPPEINLGNTAFAAQYSKANVTITGKQPGTTSIMTGEPMVYGITILKNAPNRAAALAFTEFMLSPGQGIAILEKHGQPAVLPQKNPSYSKLPSLLRKFATN
jgi:molybdate/tungstate transport system substrate-binding protein